MNRQIVVVGVKPPTGNSGRLCLVQRQPGLGWSLPRFHDDQAAPIINGQLSNLVPNWPATLAIDGPRGDQPQTWREYTGQATYQLGLDLYDLVYVVRLKGHVVRSGINIDRYDFLLVDVSYKTETISDPVTLAVFDRLKQSAPLHRAALAPV